MASSEEIAKEDREFISKLMQLDPRDRPSAKVLLQIRGSLGAQQIPSES